MSYSHNITKRPMGHNSNLGNNSNQWSLTHLLKLMIIPECWLIEKQIIITLPFYKLDSRLIVSFTQAKGCFVPSLVKIDPAVLEKKMKMWKVYRRTSRQTMDNRRSDKLTKAVSTGELRTMSCHWKFKPYNTIECKDKI